ncbi:hypothetical protein BK123_26000 [Paenibacillus lautus]|uniref:Uncharacterized protein n=1 Tax=Paenibacillus lautus TaxID=1401 RepID=A0A1R1AW69_PAELA|nr:hypothetical protein BK123_26000 [Paenibacillus lautus]
MRRTRPLNGWKRVLSVDLDSHGAAFCTIHIEGGSPVERIVPEGLFLQLGTSEGLLLGRCGVESDGKAPKPEPL